MLLPLERDKVRELVTRAFRQEGAVAFRESDILESALFDGGKCVAWTYRFQDLMAMWLIEVDLVQFYDAEGNMLHTATLHKNEHSRRMAA